jgi:hypothetical protein
MALTISRPVQIFALVAIVAAVGGVGMLALKPKHAASPPLVVTKAPVKPATTAPTHRATTTPSVTAKPAVAPKPATTAPKPPVSPVGKNGLPNALNAAFRKHRIVVVSLFDPQSSTDAISYAEARAGAGEAGAGFLGVSLMDSTTAGALTTALPGGGLLPEPGILIYRAPGTLVERIDGFTDRDVVAQAAAASVTAPALTGS